MRPSVLGVLLLVGAGLLLVASPIHAAAPDADGDGLTDALERAFGSDSQNPDTDGDGFRDGLEVANGYSPVSAEPKKLPKRLLVDLSEQKLRQELGGVVIEEHRISSGKASTPTPVGTFTVLSKHPRAWSNRAKLWMPNWMAFKGTVYGIHELPEWPGGKKEGESHLGTPVSGGCIRVGVGVAKRLYEWSPIGTPVIIQR